MVPYVKISDIMVRAYAHSHAAAVASVELSAASCSNISENSLSTPFEVSVYLKYVYIVI
jgi:hypothetical protein